MTANSGEKQVDFGLEKGEGGVIQFKEDLIGGDFPGKVGSLEGFSTVESESQVVKKNAEMSGDGIYKGIKVKLIDQEIGKVTLDGVNCSRSLGVNMNKATSGVKECGHIKGGNCVCFSNGNSIELRSRDMVNANNIESICVCLLQHQILRCRAQI